MAFPWWHLPCFPVSLPNPHILWGSCRTPSLQQIPLWISYPVQVTVTLQLRCSERVILWLSHTCPSLCLSTAATFPLSTARLSVLLCCPCTFLAYLLYIWIKSVGAQVIFFPEIKTFQPWIDFCNMEWSYCSSLEWHFYFDMDFVYILIPHGQTFVTRIKNTSTRLNSE